MLIRIAKALVLVLAALAVLAFGAWGVLFLHFAGPGGALLRTVLAGGVAVATLASFYALIARRSRLLAFAVYAVVAAALLAYWSSLEPRMDRDWQPDLALLPYATVDGDLVTVHNIRDFDYRTESDFTPRYFDRTYDLSKLRSLDIVTSYWGSPAIAHVFLSFGFGDDDYLAISVEVRKPKGEGYSTLKGFFRQYELIYVVATERDVIRLRTNIRDNPPEDVYVYRVKGSVEAGRRVFREYVRNINLLARTPEFYNTLEHNCTTTIWVNNHVNAGRVPLDWRILASGYVPDYLFALGRLESDGLTFPELKRRAHVNARARAADAAADFSRRIRAR